MARIERKVLAINDRLASLEAEEQRVSDELSFHRSLADDAARDAAVIGDPIERENAAVTAADVRRFERRLTQIVDQRQRLETRRSRLLEKLE